MQNSKRRYIGAGEGNDFTINVDDIIKSIEENDPKLTIICNPNNPTGTTIKRDDVLRIVKSTDNVVIVDEAYMEFSNESVVDEIENYDNLIVVKTMSKAFSMAGIRTGYLIANEELVKTIEKVRPPYNLNSISALLATKALKQKDKMLSYGKFKSRTRKKKINRYGRKSHKSGELCIFIVN